MSTSNSYRARRNEAKRNENRTVAITTLSSVSESVDLGNDYNCSVSLKLHSL